MADRSVLGQAVAAVSVEAAVFRVRPDYRAVLIAASGLRPGPSDDRSDEVLRHAEAEARSALAQTPVDQLPHVAAWRDAYRAFGAKPQRTRNSLEALMRRVETGLPRVNRLTDLSNAVSIAHQIPLGGEHLDRYQGPARLTRATGEEPFDVVVDGQPTIEHPEPGEIVWRDDAGVTCRRWNWRQGLRTRLTDATSTALFILDVLDPVATRSAEAAAERLVDELRRLGPDVRTVTRTVGAGGSGT